MVKQSNFWSFYLTLSCLVLGIYSFYSNVNNAWLIAPPTSILLFLSLLAFALCVIGFQDRRTWKTKMRSWVTLFLALLLMTSMLFVLAFTSLFSNIGKNEHLKTISSPNHNYTIDFYSFDAGATGPFGVRGELDGPLWFKKRVYYEEGVHQVTLQWESDTILKINSTTLNLGQAEEE
ncbi:membrane protein [Pontibacillus chungwhensis BH030062]|uniref:Membrane protein n=1 Tax=Pontibacillus chungwhensis BH030062 TaxID=1385513 RepID=A0A0A2UUB6_9BACI|nr:DUF5412 family protein [Pontibacillus chungwhensis]KGP91847.1 membrane protein [Pontibacillus chungwhensis BH030062]